MVFDLAMEHQLYLLTPHGDGLGTCHSSPQVIYGPGESLGPGPQEDFVGDPEAVEGSWPVGAGNLMLMNTVRAVFAFSV